MSFSEIGKLMNRTTQQIHGRYRSPHFLRNWRVNADDLTGKVINNVKVLRRAAIQRKHSRGETWNGRVVCWECICPFCSKEFITSGKNLVTGTTRSCGCYQKALASMIFTTHGKARTPEYKMWSAAQRRARKFGWEFSITIDDIVIPEYCPVFGIRLCRDGKSRSYCRPSLDRVDNSRGYVPGNIAVVSWRANQIKSNLTLDEAIKLAEWMKGLLKQNDIE